jgi:hypothetical protein
MGALFRRIAAKAIQRCIREERWNSKTVKKDFNQFPVR